MRLPGMRDSELYGMPQTETQPEAMPKEGISVKIWSTPQPVFDKLNAEFNFDMDVCADPDNAKCPTWYSHTDGLSSYWGGTCFLNPPYGRNQIDPWLAKALWIASIDWATVVCLVPSRTNSPWWHEYAMKATEIRFVRKKLSFFGGKGVPFWGNAILVFRKGQVGQTPKVSSWIQPEKPNRKAVANAY